LTEAKDGNDDWKRSLPTAIAPPDAIPALVRPAGSPEGACGPVRTTSLAGQASRIPPDSADQARAIRIGEKFRAQRALAVIPSWDTNFRPRGWKSARTRAQLSGTEPVTQERILDRSCKHVKGNEAIMDRVKRKAGRRSGGQPPAPRRESITSRPLRELFYRAGASMPSAGFDDAHRRGGPVPNKMSSIALRVEDVLVGACPLKTHAGIRVALGMR